MPILLVYATNSSGTQSAAEIIRDVLRSKGHDVTMKRATLAKPTEMNDHEFIILGSCTWERYEGKKRLDGQLQEHMYSFVQAAKGMKLSDKKIAIYALGDRSYTKFSGAADYLEEFVKTLGAAKVGNTLRIDGYFFYPEKNQKLVADWAASLLP